jgi:hypothetical protein
MGKSSSVSMIGLLIIFVDTCTCSVTLAWCQYHHNKNSIGGVKVSLPSLSAVYRRFKSRVIGGHADFHTTDAVSLSLFWPGTWTYDLLHSRRKRQPSVIGGVKVSVPSMGAVDRRFKSRVIGGVKVSVPSMGAVDHRFKSRVIGGTLTFTPPITRDLNLRSTPLREGTLTFTSPMTRDLNLRSTAFEEGTLTCHRWCEG